MPFYHHPKFNTHFRHLSTRHNHNNNNKTALEKEIENQAEEMLKTYSDSDGSFNYRKLLEDTKRNSENEYKRIAELAHGYEFKDSETHKTIQKWLINTRRNITRLEKEIENLEKGKSGKGRRIRRKESASNKSVRLAQEEQKS